MKYFRLKWDDSTSADIAGTHRWQLPHSIGCPDCGVYGAIGASHPTIDLSDYPGASRLPPTASWRQFRELAAELAPFLRGIPCQPGDTLGPFNGRLKGTPTDFVVGDIALLFAPASTLRRLDHAMLTLPFVAPAALRRGKTELTDWFEFDIPQAGMLSDAAFPPFSHRCSTCGRMDAGLENAVLDAASLPTEIDVFRVLNHSTLLIATERFREVVRGQGLSGLLFEPVATDV